MGSEPPASPHRIATLEKIDAIGRAEWESLAIPTCYQSFDWLRGLETAIPGSARYVAVFDTRSDRLLAATPCYLLWSSSTRTHYNVVKLACGALAVEELNRPGAERLRDQHRRAAAELHATAQTLFPALLVGARAGYVGGALLQRRGLLAESVHEEVMSMLHDGVVNLAAMEGCRLVAFLYAERSEPLAAKAHRLGAIELAIEPRAELAVRWPDFEAYVKELPRSWRGTVRRDLKRFHAAGLSTSVALLKDFDSHLLGRLSQNLHEKYNGPGAGPDEFVNYIDNLKQVPLPAFVYLAAREELPVGFTLAFQYRRGLSARVAGFDYRYLGRDSCYFNVTYYKPIAHALGRGVRTIDYGIGTMDAKLARGCELIPQYGYIVPIDVTDRTRRALERAAHCVTLAKEGAWQNLRQMFPTAVPKDDPRTDQLPASRTNAR